MTAILCLVVIELALWQVIVANECSNGAIRLTNKSYYVTGIASACSTGDIRMTDKTYIIAGGLQVCAEQKWATVCHSQWGSSDADVACRQLGLSYEGEQKWY